MNDEFQACVKFLAGDLPEYFTPDWFKKLWFKADFNQSSDSFPKEYKYHLYNLMRYCGCIEYWMHANGVDKIKYVAMFRENPFAPEQTVTLSKGSVIKGWGEVSVLKRNQKIKIDRIYNGYVTYDHFVPPSIVWAGSGGYWKELMLDGKNPEPIVVEKSWEIKSLK